MARILVVEDDTTQSRALVRVLRSIDAEVDCAKTGSEARALVSAQSYDLVLLDLVLPDTHTAPAGRLLAEQLRADLPHDNVVIITGYAAADVEAAGFVVLEKPIDPKAILTVVKAMLRRTAPFPVVPAPVLDAPKATVEATSFNLRIPKSAAMKIAASLILTALGSVTATFLAVRSTVQADHEQLAAIIVQVGAHDANIRQLQVSHAVLDAKCLKAPAGRTTND